MGGKGLEKAKWKVDFEEEALNRSNYKPMCWF
jgi:hypothetical protein